MEDDWVTTDRLQFLPEPTLSICRDFTQSRVKLFTSHLLSHYETFFHGHGKVWPSLV
jgi:hypothetical protein